MKKRTARTLAVVLASSMVFSNIVWAENGNQAEASYRSVSATNGLPRSTPSDAEKDQTLISKATSSNAMLQKVLTKVSGTELTLVLKNQGTAYVYQDIPVEVQVNDETILKGLSNYCSIYMKAPDNDSAVLVSSVRYQSGSVAAKIAGNRLKKAGTYEFYLADSQTKERLSEPVTVSVEKFSSMTVTFSEKLDFSKTYGSDDSTKRYLYSGDIKNMIVNGEAVERPYELSNVSIVREPGEDAGSYKILSLKSDQCDNISVTPNEYSYFVIKKQIVRKKAQDIILDADGNEKVIDLADLFKLNDKQAEGLTVKLGTLTDADKELFSVQPKAEGKTIRFALKSSAEVVKASIPFTMESKGYVFEDADKNPELALHVASRQVKLVDSHTEEEIRQFLKDHPFSLSKRDTWDVTPKASVTAPVAGVLSEESQMNALNSLNFMRFIAGISPDVSINDEYAAKVQAGTTLLTAIGKGLTHYPKQPEGMPQDFYELGSSGTKESNLGMGYSSAAVDVIEGWMDDGDSSNIDRVGHRRWCLDPNMKETAFGHSGSYTGMYSFDSYNRDKVYEYDYVPWPGYKMPVDYFSGPWSVTLSPEVYKQADKSRVKVTLTSKKTGKTYSMDQSDTKKSGKYLNVNNTGYGSYKSAIIFKPNVTFSAGDEVTVTITGLEDMYGNDASITYTVDFFQLNSSSGGSGSGSGGSSGGGSSRPSGSSGSGGSSSGGGSRPGSSSSSGGSSSGGGGFSSGSRGSGVSRPGSSTAALPSYVTTGSWTQSATGQWRFTDAAGNIYTNRWAAVANPYANAALGQSPFDWFRFDEEGNMLLGWYQESDGNLYYLNPVSDGTRGKMVTGWVWIPDANGVKHCYYFNPVSDGVRGKKLANTTVEGYQLNAEGQWVVNGVVQTQQ